MQKLKNPLELWKAWNFAQSDGNTTIHYTILPYLIDFYLPFDTPIERLSDLYKIKEFGLCFNKHFQARPKKEGNAQELIELC